MVERRSGWVLVLASTASFQPVPYIATYAASKAFDRFFALGLAAEVARFGVKVTALCPGPTKSEFFDVAHASAFKNRGMQPAEDVARLAICSLGARPAHPHPNLQQQVHRLSRPLSADWAGLPRYVEKAVRPA
jgi:short-subunit dehydrogenase